MERQGSGVSRSGTKQWDWLAHELIKQLGDLCEESSAGDQSGAHLADGPVNTEIAEGKI
jgi:hypothetical protein